ncbi:hypothetical protein [Bowdeniella nasicola]|uniref:hypothetical protein n=1 Tax=Bowdeniella nasicola TaxID=208480 RepID=UPI001161077C|nr:hypothetical protein [Bowdeniella nasicola]
MSDLTASRIGREPFYKTMLATRLPSATAWALLFVCVIVSALLQKNFFSQYSISSSFATFLPLVLVAFGQAIVVIGGGLDLVRSSPWPRRPPSLSWKTPADQWYSVFLS